MRLRSVLTVLAVLAVSVSTYTYSSYGRWTSPPVTFYVNPANADVSAAAAVSAIQFAMNVWNTQGGSPFRYVYGGPASDTTNAYDNRNVVLFRNASNGSSIATTYSWWDSSSHLLDSDIIVWDGGFTFFTGDAGCGIVPNAAYLEDVATHELGHALGLNHSSYTDATMYPSYSYCSQELRTLAPDDIAAVQSLYGAAGPPAPINTPPTVVITSPANGATVIQNSTISLAATATDSEDGNISSKVQWTDNGGAFGTGSVVSALLGVLGTHTYVARVTDSGGLQGSSQVSITVTAPDSSSATLTATGRKVRGYPRVDLRWSGLLATTVSVYRNGSVVSTFANTNAYTDSINSKAAGTYTYSVCAAGTQTCTNRASVTF